MSTRVTRSRASLGDPKANLPKQSTSANKVSKKASTARASPNTSRKRKQAAVKQEDDEVKSEEDEEIEEPMMSGALQSPSSVKKEEEEDAAEPPKKRRSKKETPKKEAPKKAAPKKTKKEQSSPTGNEMADCAIENRDNQHSESTPSKSSRQKNNPYGLSPGVSPYPTFEAPTQKQCQEVNDILEKVHGKVTAPKTIPQPSLNSSGCGEVPSVLDALIRTRLSAATNGNNSSRAFRGLVEKFGIIKEGVGKGSVDWEKVRQAPVKDVYEAIKAGGLADVKSKDIQAILGMVKEENDADRAKEAKDEDDDTAKEAREKEVSMANSGVLSLDHLHTMKDREAMEHLLRYPGIGPKTASCVLLFCMQRPSFAVDTHVFRLTRWLGWVPSDQQARGMWKRGECKSKVVSRETAYAHMETKIPDDLKYPLHYLLIKHGKTCGWCSAKAGAASKVGTCPLAGLMSGKGRSKGLAKKGGQNEESDGSEGEGSEDEDEQSEELHGNEIAK